MPRGSYAIYREQTGLEGISAGATVTIPYDTTVHQDSIFSIDAGRDTVTVSASGHYLVLYNHAIAFGSPAAAGVELNARIKINGVASPYGTSTGTIDGTVASADTRAFSSGFAILSLSAGDTVEVEASRTDSNIGAVVRAPASVSGSGLQLIKLSDAWDYLRLRLATSDLAASSTTFADFEWNAQDEVDAASFAHSTSVDAEEITLVGSDSSDWFLVTLNVYFRMSTLAGLASPSMRILIDDGSGFVEVPGTRVTGHMRFGDSCIDHVCSFVGLVKGKDPTTTTDPVLKVQYAHEHVVVSGTEATVAPKADLCALTIAKLTPFGDGNFLFLREVTGGQIADTSSNITWDTEDEEGSSYTHSTTSSAEVITINEAALYLVCATLYSDRTASGTPNASRVRHHLEWQGDTGGGYANKLWGGFGTLNRGDATANTGFKAGTSGGAIFELASGELLRLRHTNDTAVNDATCVFQGGMMALQAVNLGRLIGQVVVDEASLEFSEAVMAIPSLSVVVSEGVDWTEDVMAVQGQTVAVAEALEWTETVVAVTAEGVFRGEARGDIVQPGGHGDVRQMPGFRGDLGGQRVVTT